MQISRISLATLFLAALSAASATDPVARDLSFADVAGEVQKREFIEARSKKVKGSGGSEEEAAATEEDDGNAAASLRLNIALVAGAGAIAVGAMMV